jgi:hypothetical protein
MAENTELKPPGEETTHEKTAQEKDELQDYAGGWMMERKNTEAPKFLKLAFPVIGLFGVGYLVVYMNGEINHPERGALVRQFNTVSKSADWLMYVIAAMVFAFVCIVVTFAVRSHKEHD